MRAGKKSSVLLTLFLLLIVFICPPPVKAEELSCPNRIVTLVNPVRGRDLWVNRDLSQLQREYEISASRSLPATWLLQYDALVDEDVTSTIKNFQVKGEVGVFLEISRNMADDSAVASPLYVRWSDPSVVFLSAYSQSERRRLIDKLYQQFKETFGYYPKSVGAWWIDSYSLNYIKSKYGLSSILIVADQKTTDGYGVWGQWWGVPYYPSKENVLAPAVSTSDNLGSVVIQWAQRDPVLAYGAGPAFSNFSVQANDYVRSGKNTSFFISLAKKYLDCRNKVGQLTVGLETGMESSGFLGEYGNQVQALTEMSDLQFMTMSEFANIYESLYQKNPPEAVIGDWVMTGASRENRELGDKLNYNRGVSFADYFVADRSSFLSRDLSTISQNPNVFSSTVVLILLPIFALMLIAIKRFNILVWSILTGIVVFGLVFRSYLAFGWEVFYGPIVVDLVLVQILLLALVPLLATFLFSKRAKRSKLFLWLIPLSYGLDWLLGLLRFTNIQGSTYFGIFINRVYFVGIIFGNFLKVVYLRYSPSVAGAFLGLPLGRLQMSFFGIALLLLMHLAVAYFIYLLVKGRAGFRVIVVLLLTVMLLFEMISVFRVDPRVAVPALL